MGFFKSRNNFRAREQYVQPVKKTVFLKTPTVRLLNKDKSMLGVMSASEARAKAEELGLEFIPLNENCDPAVYMLGDYNKYMYEQNKARKELDKKNRAIAKAAEEKELSYPSDTTDSSRGDRERLLAQANDFLASGHPVRFSLRFNGRKASHIHDVMPRIREEMVEHITAGTVGANDISGNKVSVLCTPSKK